MREPLKLSIYLADQTGSRNPTRSTCFHSGSMSGIDSPGSRRTRGPRGFECRVLQQQARRAPRVTYESSDCGQTGEALFEVQINLICHRDQRQFAFEKGYS